MEAFSLRTAGLRCEPLAVVDDVINAFHDSARAPGPEPAAQQAARPPTHCRRPPLALHVQMFVTPRTRSRLRSRQSPR